MPPNNALTDEEIVRMADAIPALDNAEQGRIYFARAIEKLVAPAMHENPDSRWEDPKLPDFRLIWKTARECGYSVGLHGSLKRDVDLIAAPWTDEAVGNAELVERLCTSLNAKRVDGPEHKPLGRVAVTLQIDGWYKPIDLSICPRVSPVQSHEAWVKEAERLADEYALQMAFVPINEIPHKRAPLLAHLSNHPAAVPEGFVIAPNFRGYALLGSGQYFINHSRSDVPAELIISVANENERRGLAVGDTTENPDGTVLTPENMAVRIGFASEAGLNALENQLRLFREVHFPKAMIAATKAGKE